MLKGEKGKRKKRGEGEVSGHRARRNSGRRYHEGEGGKKKRGEKGEGRPVSVRLKNSRRRYAAKGEGRKKKKEEKHPIQLPGGLPPAANGKESPTSTGRSWSTYGGHKGGRGGGKKGKGGKARAVWMPRRACGGSCFAAFFPSKGEREEGKKGGREEDGARGSRGCSSGRSN